MRVARPFTVKARADRATCLAHLPAFISLPIPVVSRAQPARSARRRWRTHSTDDDKLHETKLGPNVLAGIKEVKENTKWAAATVIKNE